MKDYKKFFRVYAKIVSEKIKGFFNSYGSHLRSIPALIRLASLVSLLLISGATFYSVKQLNHLEQSNNTLLQIALPLKSSVQSLDKHQKQTKFLFHKYLVLRDSAYLAATLEEIEQQKATLIMLNQLLEPFTEMQNLVNVLNADIKKYWKIINEPNSPPNFLFYRVIEEDIELGIKKFTNKIDVLAEESSQTSKEATEDLVRVLLLLIICTVLSGIGISSLYAITAVRSMKKIRRVLYRIGKGHYDEHLNLEGMQELRNFSEDINNMQRKLRKLELDKTESLSLISHELKTPLASLQSGLDMLLLSETDKLSPMQHRITKILQTQTLSLKNSIQEMLDMQAIQTQRLVMDMRSSNITDVVNNAIEQIMPLTRKKNQRIVKVGLSGNMQACIDSERTQQIMLNLLSNANKYSPDNTKITVKLASFVHFVEITIKDEGDGIPEEFLDKACERFFQIPVAGAHLRGTGLGLAIAKEITLIQGGQLFLKNHSQGGLCVYIQLPLHSADTVLVDNSIKEEIA